MGYSPWGHKESDMTEQLILSLFTFMENREYLKADLRVKKSGYPFDALFELFLDSQVNFVLFIIVFVVP